MSNGVSVGGMGFPSSTDTDCGTPGGGGGVKGMFVFARWKRGKIEREESVVV